MFHLHKQRKVIRVLFDASTIYRHSIVFESVRPSKLRREHFLQILPTVAVGVVSDHCNVPLTTNKHESIRHSLLL